MYRLNEESRKDVERNFNADKVREQVIKSKSMFKGSLRLKELFYDDD